MSAAADAEGCIFCSHLAAGDEEKSHILARTHHSFVLLNAYPYNTGHLMVAPVRHVADLENLTADERADLMELTARSLRVLREAMNPNGFNLGMNLGSVAGAGVPGHCHMHVVPRWRGDTNFMTTVGDTKVLPELIEETDRKLRPRYRP